MAESGVRLLSDPELWARMSVAGRERAVDLFRDDRVVPQYEEFYAEVLDS
jgi:glycosyltransferase involved in cell wall biosynthesis